MDLLYIINIIKKPKLLKLQRNKLYQIRRTKMIFHYQIAYSLPILNSLVVGRLFSKWMHHQGLLLLLLWGSTNFHTAQKYISVKAYNIQNMYTHTPSKPNRMEQKTTRRFPLKINSPTTRNIASTSHSLWVQNNVAQLSSSSTRDTLDPSHINQYQYVSLYLPSDSPPIPLVRISSSSFQNHYNIKCLYFFLKTATRKRVALMLRAENVMCVCSMNAYPKVCRT